jgi:hypothetical protein
MITLPKIGARVGPNRWSDGKGGTFTEEQHNEWMRRDAAETAKVQQWQREQRGQTI